MTSDVAFCLAGDDLVKAVGLMKDRNCSAVPVVDTERRVIGMISDRDVCLAVVARDQRPSEIAVQEIISGEPAVCAAGDKLKEALRTMRKRKVKTLAVTNDRGELAGVVALSDIVLYGDEKKSVRKRVFSVLKNLNRPVVEETVKPSRIVLVEESATSVDER